MSTQTIEVGKDSPQAHQSTQGFRIRKSVEGSELFPQFSLYTYRRIRLATHAAAGTIAGKTLTVNDMALSLLVCHRPIEPVLIVLSVANNLAPDAHLI